MKIFRKKDGGIIQIIDKEKMREWPVELPLIFIEYIRDKQLDRYEDAAIKKQVSSYLDEVLKDVAIPRLLNVLDGENTEEIILALTRIEELSKKNIEMIKPIKPYLTDLNKIKNKEISKLAEKISNAFSRAEKRKEMAKKRDIMREKEKLFLEGKIKPEEYAKARKDYLILRD